MGFQAILEMMVSKHEPSALDLQGLTLVVVAAACLAGMVLDSLMPLPSLALLAGAAVALLLLIPLWRDAMGRLAMLILLSLLLGAWRYTVASGLEDAQRISKFIGAGKVEIQGTLSDEPKISGKSLVLAITVSEVSTDQGKTWQQADGQIVSFPHSIVPMEQRQVWPFHDWLLFMLMAIH